MIVVQLGWSFILEHLFGSRNIHVKGFSINLVIALKIVTGIHPIY